jgi:hypothetical protein
LRPLGHRRHGAGRQPTRAPGGRSPPDRPAGARPNAGPGAAAQGSSRRSARPGPQPADRRGFRTGSNQDAGGDAARAATPPAGLPRRNRTQP